jgi:hypothetical protein
MTDVLLAKKPVKLIVYGYPEEKTKYIRAMLTLLSGLNAVIGINGLLGRKVYTYFDDVASANVAALAVVRMTCCRTKVRIGIFDVKNVVKDNNRATVKDLRLQTQVSKTKIAKEASSIIDAKRRCNTEKHYKNIE